MSLLLALDKLFSSSLLRRREEEQAHQQVEAYEAMYYKEEGGGRDMMIEVVAGNGHQLHQQMILAESSGEDPEVKAPKKRAETWVQEETRSLIGFRREMDGLFNTSKSNKHLWQQISSKMRDKGFDRLPTMCTDKWRNLLKEFKKAKEQLDYQNLSSPSEQWIDVVVVDQLPMIPAGSDYMLALHWHHYRYQHMYHELCSTEDKTIELSSHLNLMVNC